jgi:hypothetical protein
MRASFRDSVSHFSNQLTKYRVANAPDGGRPTAFRYLNDKVYVKNFVHRHGFPVSRPYRLLASPDSLLKISIPETFALKPSNSFGSQGFFQFRRVFHDLYADLVGNTFYRASDIVSKLNSSKRPNTSLIIEECLLGDHRDKPEEKVSRLLLDDYKFYMFYGEIGCILQKRWLDSGKVGESPNGFIQWYQVDEEGDWSVVNTGNYYNKMPGYGADAKRISPPHLKNELCLLAVKLSKLIKVPFCRVDLYATNKGAYFGEYTFVPGWFPNFCEEWDVILGECWRVSEERLKQSTGVNESFSEGIESYMRLFFEQNPNPDSMLAKFFYDDQVIQPVY